MTTSRTDTETLEHLDPATLILDTNIRLDPRLDADFIASIKASGVIEPVIATRHGDEVRVRMGKRRVLGAIEAGRTDIRVLIVPDQGAADRITDQLVENLHRLGITPHEEHAAVQELLGLGLTARQIVNRTRMAKDTVDRHTTVAGSELASAALGRYEFMTLDHAAAVAEFDGDTDAVTALIAAAKNGGQFEHVLQRMRDQRASDAQRAALTGELTAAGVTVLGDDASLDWWQREGRGLREPGPDGTSGELIAEEVHAACPGRVAKLDQEWDKGAYKWVPRYYCADPAAHGHYAPEPEVAGEPAAVPEPDPEADKAARREVRENNQLWRSATTVRRTWLRTFACRKTPPPDGMRFLLAAMTRADFKMVNASWKFNPLGCELLGITEDDKAGDRGPAGRGAAEALVAAANDKRAQVIVLTLLLAAYEWETDLIGWRSTSDTAKRYLRQLGEWGYDLSPVEEKITGPKDGGE